MDIRTAINLIEAETARILYHQAPVVARQRIMVHGLQHPFEQDEYSGGGEEESAGIFFSDHPEIDPRTDLWKVDVTGLNLVPDETTEWPDGHTWWVTYTDSVGPERVTLVHKGTGF